MIDEKKIDEAIEELRERKRTKSQLLREEMVENALALLESAKAEQPAVVEPGEFTKDFRLLIEGDRKSMGFAMYQKSKEACDRLEAQQEQIEKWKVEAQAGRALWVEAQTARKRLALDVDRLTADLRAKDERIAELEKNKGNCIGCGEPIDHEYCQRCQEQWAS